MMLHSKREEEIEISTETGAKLQSTPESSSATSKTSIENHSCSSASVIERLQDLSLFDEKITGENSGEGKKNLKKRKREEITQEQDNEIEAEKSFQMISTSSR
jgi:hypothetical protein